MPPLTPDDVFLLKLTAWRENRGGGQAGMQSVMNAILNRAAKHGEPVCDVCTDPGQFDSLVTLGDPETVKWARAADAIDLAAWEAAGELAASAAAGMLVDLTGGATLYYAPDGLVASERAAQPYAIPGGSVVPFPKGWNRAAIRFTRQIVGQVFFAEL